MMRDGEDAFSCRTWKGKGRWEASWSCVRSGRVLDRLLARARGDEKKEEILGAGDENLWVEKWVGRLEVCAHRPKMQAEL
jgi:hypothetical protein